MGVKIDFAAERAAFKARRDREENPPPERPVIPLVPASVKMDPPEAVIPPKGEGQQRLRTMRLRQAIATWRKENPEETVIMRCYEALKPGMTYAGFVRHYKAAERGEMDPGASGPPKRRKEPRKLPRPPAPPSAPTETVNANTNTKPALVPDTPATSPDDRISFASAQGSFSAVPVDGEWLIEMRVKVTRSQLLGMSGRAWELLFPQEGPR